jgi:predicted secreted protein
MSVKFPIVGKKRLSVGLGLLAALLIALMGLMAVFAVNDEGLVELDGNVVDDAAAGTDWGPMYDPGTTPSTGKLVNTPAGTIDSVFVQDFVLDASGPDPSYHEPSNKDAQVILASGGSSVWGCGSASNPTDKDDILNATSVAIDNPADDHRIFYVAGDRFDNSGTAFLGAWFFQKKVECDEATGKFVNAEDPTQPGKTDGDILILVNFSKGGAPANISMTALRWSPGATPTAAGTFTPIAASADARCSVAPPGDALCGEVNFGDVPTNGTYTSVWPFQDKDTPNGTTNGTVKLAEFFEGGLDLTTALGLPPGEPAPCFSTFMLETRSSDSITATLKDYALGSFETCGGVKAIKYHDLNANGQDDSEPRLSDWTIFIDENSNETLDAGETSQVTDANGEALFDNLQAGSYSFCEVLQNNWFNSDPDSGTLCKSVNVVVSDTPTEVKFGNYQNATKSGYKFHDLNANGVDNSEPRLPDWTINLNGTDGLGNAVSLTTTTDASGNYSFSVPPGSYTVDEDCPAGWRQSYPSPTTSEAGCGNNTYAITLTSQEVDSDNNFGNFRNATKSGVKFHDLNANGQQDAGEPGLSGWTINATATGGSAVSASTTTGAGGSYSLSLTPGSYDVSEACPAGQGWRQSQPGPTTDAAHCGDNKYSITLTSGQVDSDNHFGNFKNATKSGVKYEDLNANGTQDAGEPGLSGWTINATATGGSAVSASTTTGAGGSYSLSLTPGSYDVSEACPAGQGWRQSQPGPTTDAAHCGDNKYSITLTSGQVDSDNHFGNFKNATKSGVKYEDLNANGTQDAGEPGLSGWTINATATGGSAVSASTTTGAGGSYSLSLTPGSYDVGEACPAGQGWRQSQPGPVTDAAHCGDNKYSITLISQQVDSDNHFGNFRNATKSGYKFRDDNGNGTQDAGEPRLSGWTISLNGTDGQGAAVSLTDTTDANGDYSFDVTPGSYTVCETLQTGWEQTLPSSGADCGGSLGYSITLTSAQVDNDNNFGNRQLFKLIVITCDTVTETLVDSTVTMDGVDTQTITTPPAGITQAQLCGLGGASYDNLPQGTYNPSVELPDLPPLFP